MSTSLLPGADLIERGIELVMRPEPDATLRAIPVLEERLHLNVELASPDQFIPVAAGWESRSPLDASDHQDSSARSR